MPTLVGRLISGVYMAHHLRGQARYSYRPLAAIEADRDQRARRMVSYAYRYVPYYRETMRQLGLSPDDFQCAGDLARLPLVRSGQMQRDPQLFVSTESPLADYVAVCSSGTTGKPCDFFLDRRTLWQYAAHDQRARAVFAPLLGRSVGYRQTKIGSRFGPAAHVQEFYDTRSWLPPGVALHRQVLSVADPPEVNARLIDQFRPDVLRSYGSYLAMLFHYLHVSGQEMHLPKVLRYTADTLDERARKLIESEFGLPVFATYDATEVYNIAFECEEHSGLHINVDLCPVRIVDADGRNLPPGVSGTVVISNLLNRGTVFLNYVLEDVAAISPLACTCGRSLPLLTELRGRSEDWLELPSGRWLHAVELGPMIKGNKGIWQFQVIQDSRSHLTILLVCSSECFHDSTRERVAAAAAAVFGPSVQVSIRFVDSVQRTTAGKARSVISKCTQGRWAKGSSLPLASDRREASGGAAS